MPVLLWAALILALSSIPSLSTGLGTWDFVLRKLAHATEYAILGALLVRATASDLGSFLLGVAYAVTDEVHQTFVPGRAGAVVDVGIDAAGVLVGIALWRLAVRGRRRDGGDSPRPRRGPPPAEEDEAAVGARDDRRSLT